ncbi:MAG: NADH-quinone oxidoreductase subunit NuoF [Anaerolineae bacterium]|nr:NADH-quinone oxidoreductase subunit NuoF [Anaerolineae bacterium]MDW8070794.1 NADH-quinone oxidoreductase subunit NuoF [Anaerolineae bacterium]
MVVLREHILLRHRDIPDIGSLEVYLAHGGYQALAKALRTLSPGQVIELVKASGLRGRGGAGFPTGLKWSFVPQDAPTKYVVVNADESEPGTFKDREIIEGNPHQLLEGTALCAYAIGARVAYIYGRGEFRHLFAGLQRAIDEAYQAGWLGQNIQGSDFSLDVYLHLGAGAYICGEETALLESLEGKLGMPRARPPFPAQVGLYGQPTVVNNVETLANVPPIVRHGPEWYRQFGTERSPGVKIFCLSGCITRPGNYELPLGVPLRVLIEECGGGAPDGRAIQAILPSGASSLLLPGYNPELRLDYESLQAAGAALGSASFVVLDETVDIVWAVSKVIRFFEHESCGKCTPCREGTYWMVDVYRRLLEGRAWPDDVELLLSIADQMDGNCFCALGEFAICPVRSSIQHFRPAYEARLPGRGA